MFQRKAVFTAVASLLASAGFAMAGSEVQTAHLTLNPSTVTADDAAAAPQAPLMMGLDKLGAAKPLNDLGINIYGWIEAGYSISTRHNGSNLTFAPTAPGAPGQSGNTAPTVTRSGLIIPGPFNHEYGNHFMLNQLDLRFERLVDSKKWDVGGLVEVLYGTDAARIHSAGLSYNGSDSTDNNQPADPSAVTNFNPSLQFDIPQAYVDVNVPVGNGLKLRAGKFVTLLSYETIDPRSNPFYSHSYLFNLVPFTQTGLLGFYQINDQWSVVGGFTRGWDVALEDSNVGFGEGEAIDFLGQVTWTPNKQWTALVNLSSGPQDGADTSHYRTVIDPIVTWQATDKLKFAVEALYLYDGGINQTAGSGVTHAYGDAWGAAGYASYTINDYVTANARIEKAHTYLAGAYGESFSTALGGAGGTGVSTENAYEITLGVTVLPFPKDPIGQNLSFRPEVRYDFSEDPIYFNGSTGTLGNGAPNGNKDQLTFACDVIFKF